MLTNNMRYAKIKMSSDEDVQRIVLSIHDCEMIILRQVLKEVEIRFSLAVSALLLKNIKLNRRVAAGFCFCSSLIS